MNKPSPQLYTNEITPEQLLELNKPGFTEEQIASFNQDAIDMIRRDQAYDAEHPVIGIYRVATEGSQTRAGGVIEKTNSNFIFTLDDGREVATAHIGDVATYADGSTARIITGAGQDNDDLALVGSRLSNGDEIINTPQSIDLMIERKGDSNAEDFLPPLKV